MSSPHNPLALLPPAWGIVSLCKRLPAVSWVSGSRLPERKAEREETELLPQGSLSHGWKIHVPVFTTCCLSLPLGTPLCIFLLLLTVKVIIFSHGHRNTITLRFCLAPDGSPVTNSKPHLLPSQPPFHLQFSQTLHSTALVTTLEAGEGKPRDPRRQPWKPPREAPSDRSNFGFCSDIDTFETY